MLSSGWLAVVFGWQSIFYLFGIIGLLWTISWFAIVRESPEQDILISHQEREYIKRCLDREGQLKIANPPWRSIFTSKPVYAIAVAHFSYTWGYYTLLTQLPAYMKDILEFDLQNTGFVSSIPFLALSILLFISGYFADRLLIKNWLSITQVRKYFTNISFLAQMIFLMLGAYFQNTTTVIICITLSVGLGSFSISGFLANPLDLAPQYASIIVGFSNTFATLPGLISPILTGYILTTPPVSL
jgi:MFS transporter, ACS family, solute carrier family 17 (sodium-dependent inorganic phosphate cotransporter), other